MFGTLPGVLAHSTPSNAYVQGARCGFVFIAASIDAGSQRNACVLDAIRRVVGDARIILHSDTQFSSPKRRDKLWPQVLDRTGIVILVPTHDGSIDAATLQYALDAYCKSHDVLAVDRTLNITRNFRLRVEGAPRPPVAATLSFGDVAW